ncbi:hypothetical protein BHE74_00039779, partial [Ensete ventricosum]
GENTEGSVKGSSYRHFTFLSSSRRYSYRLGIATWKLSEWIRLECIEDEEEEPKRIGFPPLTPYSFKSCSSETEEGESKVEEGKGRVMRVSSRVAPKRDGDAPAGQDRRRAALQV